MVDDKDNGGDDDLALSTEVGMLGIAVDGDEFFFSSCDTIVVVDDDIGVEPVFFLPPFVLPDVELAEGPSMNSRSSSTDFEVSAIPGALDKS